MAQTRRHKVKEATPTFEEVDGGWRIVWAVNGRSESSRIRYRTPVAAQAMTTSLARK